MEIRIHDETFAFEVQHDDGEQGTITLDSEAGVNAWPKAKMPEAPMLPMRVGLRTSSANSAEIANHGRRVIKIRGNEFGKCKVKQSVLFSPGEREWSRESWRREHCKAERRE